MAITELLSPCKPMAGSKLAQLGLLVVDKVAGVDLQHNTACKAAQLLMGCSGWSYKPVDSVTQMLSCLCMVIFPYITPMPAHQQVQASTAQHL